MTRLGEPLLLTDQVFSAIHEAIMSGDIPAGARLRIRDLAAQLGTSPMPVREAIGRLEQAGLAQRVPHKGAVVTDLSPAELVHVYDTRLLLEMEASRLGAAVITQSDCERMREEYNLMMAAVGQKRASEALDHDEALLTILYSAADNSVLLELIRVLWQRCRAYKIVGVRRALETADLSIWSFQARLIDAALDHDAEAAVNITEESLRQATARIEAMLPG